MAETEELSPWLELSITGLGTNILMHPWDLTVSASLGSMAVKEMTYGHGGDPLYLVETPDGAELLSMKYLKVIENKLFCWVFFFVLLENVSSNISFLST